MELLVVLFFNCLRNFHTVFHSDCTKFHSHRKCISSVQSLSGVWLFVTPWTAARQASLSITNFQSLPKFMSIELVMPSNHLILGCPLLLPPSIFPSIRVFYNESILCIRWPKYWSFSFSINPSNEHLGLISFRMDLLESKGLSRVFSNTTVQKLILKGPFWGSIKVDRQILSEPMPFKQ